MRHGVTLRDEITVVCNVAVTDGGIEGIPDVFAEESRALSYVAFIQSSENLALSVRNQVGDLDIPAANNRFFTIPIIFISISE